MFIYFVLFFINYPRWRLSMNCNYFQHVKIYIPSNFEINRNTHLGVISPFSSTFPHFNIVRIISSETNYLIGTKLSHNSPWMVPFNNYVRQVRIQSKMAASEEHSLTLDHMGNTFKDLFVCTLPIRTIRCHKGEKG